MPALPAPLRQFPRREPGPKLKAEYIDTGKVKFIQRDVYFDAVGPVRAGIPCALRGDDKILRRLGQRSLASRRPRLRQRWRRIAANLRKIGAKGRHDRRADGRLLERQAEGGRSGRDLPKNATADAIEGTPTFIIAGEKGEEPALG